MIDTVLQQYGWKENETTVTVVGSGLINTTCHIKNNSGEFILQRINTAIFKQPQYIADNISVIAQYLHKHFPGYLFVTPILTVDGKKMAIDEAGNYFRVFPFIVNSRTITVATHPAQAYEAARQFGAFTKKLSSFDASVLQISLPDFHKLSLRYDQLLSALVNGNKKRIASTKDIATALQDQYALVDIFESIKKDAAFKIRVTHHDTKISNVLFDADGKGLCVIDLDTIMPGYFISDVGDMLRTYASPANEEEQDLNKIEARIDYVKAVINGYLSEMEEELTEKEKQYLLYAGKFMIYMQALRFYTDHLNDDQYYGARYEGHNLLRAKNQLILLQKLIAIEDTILQ